METASFALTSFRHLQLPLVGPVASALFLHGIKQLKLRGGKKTTLSKQAGKQRPYCGFLFGPLVEPETTHVHSVSMFHRRSEFRPNHCRPLVHCLHFHRQPRDETTDTPSSSVTTGLATLSYKLPSCNIIAASPRKVLKELIQWSGGGVGGSVYTVSGGSVRLRPGCNYKGCRLINTGRRTLFHAGRHTTRRERHPRGV